MTGGALVLAALLAAAPVAAQVVEPQSYRGEPYRAPVPHSLAGAVTVDDDAALALWAAGRIAFIDALPAPVKPAGLPEGTLWRDPPHETIPGALWLPNTGYQALDPATQDYFLKGLAAASGGDPGAPLLFFCRADCWMSWNAAKRALEAGYARVFWYPEGTDGWAAAGRALEPATPFAP